MADDLDYLDDAELRQQEPASFSGRAYGGGAPRYTRSRGALAAQAAYAHENEEEDAPPPPFLPPPAAAQASWRAAPPPQPLAHAPPPWHAPSAASSAPFAAAPPPPPPPPTPPQTLTRADDTWTANHLKILYLISRYSKAAAAADEEEQWLRSLPLTVLIYELIATKVLDYDYAPSSELVGNARHYLNVSQEGRADVDELVEGGAVHMLRLRTAAHAPATGFQASAAGVALLARCLRAEDAVAVDDAVCWGGSLLRVAWLAEEERFVLRNAAVTRACGVTDIEDVSYVASAHLPACARPARAAGARPLSSNAARAGEAAAAAGTVRDALDSALTLSDVALLVGEFVPMGPNGLAELAARLGAGERCRGGFLATTEAAATAATAAATTADKRDAAAEEALAPCAVPPGLAQVTLLETSPCRFLNAEAAVHFPEAAGVAQVQTFGLHVRADGAVLHGLRVEAVGDRVRSHVSIDAMARLLTDVHADSSRILDALTSAAAADAMRVVFLGRAASRDKTTVLLASKLSPALPAARYLDRGPYENELRQLLGDIEGAWDLSPNDVLVVGAAGALVAGPGAAAHEAALARWLALAARGAFAKNAFARLAVAGDAARRVRAAAAAAAREADPSAVERLRSAIADVTADVTQLGRALQALQASLLPRGGAASAAAVDDDEHEHDAEEDEAARASDALAVDGHLELPGLDAPEPARRLAAALRARALRRELRARCADMAALVTAQAADCASLPALADAAAGARGARLGADVAAATAECERALRDAEKISSQLTALLVLFSGLLAFAALDRLTGSWSVVHTSWADAYIVQPLLSQPLAWFAISMLTWAVVAAAAGACVWAAHDARGARVVWAGRVNRKVDVAALRELASRRGAHAAAADVGDAGAPAARARLAWREPRAGADVEATFDARTGVLLEARLTTRRRRSAATGDAAGRADALRRGFFAQLQAAGVMAAADVAAALAESHAPALGGDAAGGRAGGSGGAASAAALAASRLPWLAEEEAPAPLQLRLAGEAVCREIPYGPLTMAELRDAVARKLRVRPTEVAALVRAPAGVLLTDDDDVARLAPGALLDVALRELPARGGAVGSKKGGAALPRDVAAPPVFASSAYGAPPGTFHRGEREHAWGDATR